jgi:hypothetical protein
LSQTERLLILQMVAEKKISADEAYELILALDASEPVAPPLATTQPKISATSIPPLPPIPPIPPTPGGRPGSTFVFSGLNNLIEGLVDRVTSSFSDSVGPKYEFTTELTGRFEGEIIPLQVVTGNGRIDLHTSDQPECRVVVITKVSGYSEDEAQIRAKDAYEASITPNGFSLKAAEDSFGGTSVSVQVFLPRGHRYRVDTRTGNGRIQVSEINMTECNVSTGNGRIQVDGGSADQLKARTGNGSVHINAEIADLTAQSGNGSVSITPQGTVSQRLDLSTGNGSIKVDTTHLPLDAAKRVEAKTAMSRIQVNVPTIKIQEESRGVGNRRFIGQSQGFESAAQQVMILAKTSAGSVTVD